MGAVSGDQSRAMELRAGLVIASGVALKLPGSPGSLGFSGSLGAIGSFGLLFVTACAAAPAPAPPASAEPPSATRDFDGDGIVDPKDRCPRDRGEAPLGCPDRDDDGDGLKASLDRCPQVPGPPPNGCPLPDADSDAVADAGDRCQGEMETLNGFQDGDGCPDAIPKDLAKITGVIKGVQFDPKTDLLTPSSKPVLDRAAAVLKRYPDVRIEISGHTDGASSGKDGRDPSGRWAEAVKKYLLDNGIESKRLETRGAGPDEPLDSNKTAAGRARNRRVEFTILVQ